MALLSITENPTITDSIVFDIRTPDVSGCYSANPYKVDRAIIFFVERSFASGNNRFYQEPTYDQAKVTAAVEAEAIACTTPSAENIAEATRLRSIADSSAVLTDVYFNKATPIKVVGNDDFPAWLSTDTDNSEMTLIEEDAEGNTQYGVLQLIWEPKGEVREGNYFLCYTWTMQPSGEPQSANQTFVLAGNTSVTTSIPTHFTVPEKYETLLDRYLPQTFKDYLARGDQTPDVLDKLNKAIAKGFTQLEDMANQTIDLFDANAVNETFLPYLSNLFNLRLKSGDPTLWRRQIKEAIPLFKRKGTLGGLKEAMSQAGMEVTKYTQLWQVVSQYTWVESFTVSDGQEDFVLSKVALPYDADNFELSLRELGQSSYEVLDPSYVSFSTTAGVTTMTWEGDSHATPISLADGDIVKILYLYKTVPGSTEQLVEDYVRTLSIADLRDEVDQVYPLKNWNVRVIEEDDPLFDVVINNRHPFHDDIIFGHIRTEFPYSENVYNMDEYNGSTRPSTEPCDISKEFLDECSNGISSKFILDVEIQDLSNDKLIEATQVIEEYVPFHSILHTMNVSGSVLEFIPTPVESVDCLVSYVINDNVISGQANSLFYRIMDNPLGPRNIARTLLATTDEVVSEQTALGYNESVVLYCPDVRFDRIPLNESDNLLEIFTPSVNSGAYVVSSPHLNTVVITPLSEPINETAFTFRLSNNIYFNPSAIIESSNINLFKDDEEDFSVLSIKTQWDVDNTSYSGGPWKVQLSYGTFIVTDTHGDGSLILDDPSGLLPPSNVSGLPYTILDDSNVSKATGTIGKLRVTARGKVTLNDISVPDLTILIKHGDYLLYAGTQYKITGYVPGSVIEVYIEGYSSGAATGVPITVYRRLVDSKIGYFHYRGIRMQAFSDLEQILGIQNGVNGLSPDDLLEDNSFKENFMIQIEDSYYSIVEIDGQDVVLGGPMSNWKTIGAGGTVLIYSVLQFNKSSINIAGKDIRFIDRRGGEEYSNVTHEIEFEPYSYTMDGGINTGGDAGAAATGSVAFGPLVSSLGNGTNIQSAITQNETVSFHIEYAEGMKEQGNIQ